MICIHFCTFEYNTLLYWILESEYTFGIFYSVCYAFFNIAWANEYRRLNQITKCYCTVVQNERQKKNKKCIAKARKFSIATTTTETLSEWEKKNTHNKNYTLDNLYVSVSLHILFLLYAIFFLYSIVCFFIFAPEKKSEYAHAYMSYWGKTNEPTTNQQ